MTFDDIVYTDPNKADRNRDLLREYTLFNRKSNKAIETERKAHPWWTLLSGIASSFVPFGLGAAITPGANAMVQARKKQVIEKQNDYRSRLGLEQNSSIPSSGLDLGGVGFSLGSSIAKPLGRDATPTGDVTLSSTIGDATEMATPNAYTGMMVGDNNNPNAPQTGQTGQTLNLPASQYWNLPGGGVDAVISPTDNGYTTAPSTSSTLQKGGKIIAPSHEEGGVELVKDGKEIGIEVEGKERIVNDGDWKEILSFLGKGKSKNALALLKDIDKRKPVEGKADDGVNLVEVIDRANRRTKAAPGKISGSGFDYNIGKSGFARGWDKGMAFDENGYPIQENSTEEAIVPTDLPVTGTAGTPNKFNWNETLGYGVDAARLGLGIEGALTPVPKWQIPQDWTDHMSKAKYLSKQGLLPESEALAKRYADANYASSVRDVTNASGGNAAAVLANLGKINEDRSRVAAELAEADSKLKQANFRQFEGTLLKDIGMKKDIFDMARGDAMRTKGAGAELMQSSISDLQNRFDYNKYYGEGSYFEKMQDTLLSQGKTQDEILKLQLDVMKNPEKYPSITANLTDKEKKALGDEKAMEELEKLVSKKEEDFSKVLFGLKSTPSKTVVSKTTVKKK